MLGSGFPGHVRSPRVVALPRQGLVLLRLIPAHLSYKCAPAGNPFLVSMQQFGIRLQVADRRLGGLQFHAALRHQHADGVSSISKRIFMNGRVIFQLTLKVPSTQSVSTSPSMAE